jgi:site-specific recombinase XerD
MRLDGTDVLQLLEMPNCVTLQGLRDMILIGLIFCAGLNESEVAVLTRDQLGHDDYGNLTIQLPNATDDDGRVVAVYDGLIFDKPWIEDFLNILTRETEPTESMVFRGYFRGGNKPNTRSLTLRGIQNMLAGYRIQVKHTEQAVTALDLRRAYARQLYLRGLDVEEIAWNMGHRQLGTTYEYIGPPTTQGNTSVPTKLDTTMLDECYDLIQEPKFWEEAQKDRKRFLRQMR